MKDKKEEVDGNFIIALSRTLRDIHKESVEMFRKHNITMAHFAVLEALLHKGDMTIGALIQAVLSTSGNMTVVIRNLEHRGYIKRRVHANDRRCYLVCLTEEGKEIIQIVFKKHMRFIEHNFSSVTMEEKEQVIHIIKKLQ